MWLKMKGRWWRVVDGVAGKPSLVATMLHIEKVMND